ncbi:MAG: peptide chain release factor 2 [Deltaproteobacteria bacterium]|nr:peptide chain release factor 2 [Deltaproteobacteria bacterium]
MLFDIKPQVKELQDRFQNLRGIFDLERVTNRLAEIDKIMAQPGFWDDTQKAGVLSKERTGLASRLELWEALVKDQEELVLFFDMAVEEEDEASGAEVASQLIALTKRLDQFEIQRMLAGNHDRNNAIVDIHAGAGGTEAQDWAEILLRMYLRWADRNSFKTQIVDLLEGEEAGIKSSTFTVTGEYAYGLLKAEVGIHRLVRISPFDASNRRHTSFASLFVMPEIDDDINIEINEKDLRVDTYRSSGAGGQHVNKTSSAVRITHIPSGIVVQSQDERSQHRNRDLAMKVLRARLYQLEEQKKADAMKKMHDGKKDIAWGSQIRSYVLQPYRLIKDHRTGIENTNVDNVLDGDLNQFIRAFLLSQAKEAAAKQP